jgi:hypothetical protein
MARAAIVFCVLVGAGCSNNPYVIGHYLGDGGLDDCGGAHAGAIVCTGFEAKDLASDWTQTVVENAGVIERSTVRAHTGRGSLHASSTARASVGVAAKDFPPLRSGDLYLRAYLFVPANLPTETMNIFFLGDDPNPGPGPFKGLDINLESGAVQVYSPQSRRETGSLMIPRQRWFCFRAHIAISADHGVVQAFVDDKPALEATDFVTLPAAGVHLLRAGVDWSSGQDAFFEIFIDDLVLDTKPVSCR